MVVVALDGRCGFLEADVVKSSKGRAADVFDCVVGDEELLLRWGGMERAVQRRITAKYGQAQFGRHLTFHLMKI